MHVDSLHVIGVEFACCFLLLHVNLFFLMICFVYRDNHEGHGRNCGFIK